jgi:hypothetical protein
MWNRGNFKVETIEFMQGVWLPRGVFVGFVAINVQQPLMDSTVH